MAETSFPLAWKVSDPFLISDTVTSRVYRVRLENGERAVVKRLKPVGLEDELRGADFLHWRDGCGCVRLLARQGDDLLLEDAGEKSLLDELNINGDEAAMQIMAQTLPAIHADSSISIPGALQPLRERFSASSRKPKWTEKQG